MPETTLNRNRLTADASEYHDPSHTKQVTATVGYRRSEATGSHRFSVKTTQGKLGVDGLPVGQNLIIETTIRRPLDFTDAEWDATMARHLDALTRTEVQTDAKAGRFPDADVLVVGSV